MVLDPGKIHRVQTGCRYHSLDEGAYHLLKDEAKASRLDKIDDSSWMPFLFVIFYEWNTAHDMAYDAEQRPLY